MMRLTTRKENAESVQQFFPLKLPESPISHEASRDFASHAPGKCGEANAEAAASPPREIQAHPQSVRQCAVALVHAGPTCPPRRSLLAIEAQPQLSRRSGVALVPVSPTSPTRLSPRRSAVALVHAGRCLRVRHDNDLWHLPSPPATVSCFLLGSSTTCGHWLVGLTGQRDSTSSASSTMEHAKRTNEHRTCVVAIVRMLGVPQMFVGRRLGGLSVFFTPAQARAWRKLGCSLVAASRIAKDFGSSATECVFLWLCAFLTVFGACCFYGLFVKPSWR